MKTKHFLLTLLLLAATTILSAQEIVKGDMNGDNEISVVDVTNLVDVALGRLPKQTVSLGVDPYKVDNTLVVGTWYAPDGTSFTLDEDGTTSYPGAATYKFRPNLGTLLFFNAKGVPVKKLTIEEVEPARYLLTTDYSKNAFIYYTGEASLATGITLDQTSLSLNSGTTAQLSATISPEDAIATITWTSSDESIATVDQNGLVTAVASGTCTITATTSVSGKTATCEVTVVQLVTSITLSHTTLNLEKEDYKKLTATVQPSNASNTKVTWSSSDENVALVTSSGLVEATGWGQCTITCTAADGSGITATWKIILNNTEYVDLGLPSGTLWAACNIGAYNPEEYGDYFAWGEVTGYLDGKTTFDWSTYKFCNGDWNQLTKYCPKYDYGYNGFRDYLIELEPADDAAYVNWGPEWRMPTNGQWEELINSNYTTSTWTSQNNVNGLLITSNTNGNSVFLPAADECAGSSLGESAGSYGFYWSRTVYESDPGSACDMSFSDPIFNYEYSFRTLATSRYKGLSVRPVRSSE